jgi:hypothetical protein
VGHYIDMLSGQAIASADRTPPVPSLGELREAGIPTVDDSEFRAGIGGLEQRRKLLLGAVHYEGREWPPASSQGKEGNGPS